MKINVSNTNTTFLAACQCVYMYLHNKRIYRLVNTYAEPFSLEILNDTTQIVTSTQVSSFQITFFIFLVSHFPIHFYSFQSFKV